MKLTGVITFETKDYKRKKASSVRIGLGNNGLIIDVFSKTFLLKNRLIYIGIFKK